MQSWEEQSENREAFLRELRRRWDAGWVPYPEIRRWKRRFWGSLLLNVLLLILWWTARH